MEDWADCPGCRRTRRARERAQDRANTRYYLSVWWHGVGTLLRENPWLRILVWAWGLYALWCLVMVALCMLGLVDS